MSGPATPQLHDTLEFDVIVVDEAEVVVPGTRKPIETSNRAITFLSLLVGLSMLFAVGLIAIAFSQVGKTNANTIDSGLLLEEEDTTTTEQTTTSTPSEFEDESSNIAQDILDESLKLNGINADELKDELADTAERSAEAARQRADQARDEATDAAKKAAEEAEEQFEEAAERVRERGNSAKAAADKAKKAAERFAD